MTDANANLDPATQAARDAAEQVRENAADSEALFGATPEQIKEDLSDLKPAEKSDLSHAVSDVTQTVGQKTSDVVEGARSAASDAAAAAGKAADAVADAAKAAGAKLKDAAGDVDFDGLVSQTRSMAGGWGEKIKQAYRERPGVVVGAAIGAVFLTAAVIRSLARR